MLDTGFFFSLRDYDSWNKQPFKENKRKYINPITDSLVYIVLSLFYCNILFCSIKVLLVIFFLQIFTEIHFGQVCVCACVRASLQITIPIA